MSLCDVHWESWYSDFTAKFILQSNVSVCSCSAGPLVEVFCESADCPIALVKLFLTAVAILFGPFQGLTVKEMEELREDIKQYLEFDSSDPVHKEFWTVSSDSLFQNMQHRLVRR